jgi:hypothetical protein
MQTAQNQQTPQDQAIWNAIQRDRSFLNEIPAGKPRELFQQFASKLPEILGEQFEAPVSFQTLVSVKLTVLRHMINSGFMTDLIRVYPEENLGGMDADDVIDIINETLGQALELFEPLAGNIVGFLEAHGITEVQALASPKICKLNRASMKLYRQQQLTIRKLLETQPMVILKFS